MSSIALERTDVIVGVDTHKDEHVAVVIDGLGGRLGEYYVSVTNSGYAELLGVGQDLRSCSRLRGGGDRQLRNGPCQVLAAPRTRR